MYYFWWRYFSMYLTYEVGHMGTFKYIEINAEKLTICVFNLVVNSYKLSTYASWANSNTGK